MTSLGALRNQWSDYIIPKGISPPTKVRVCLLRLVRHLGKNFLVLVEVRVQHILLHHHETLGQFSPKLHRVRAAIYRPIPLCH